MMGPHTIFRCSYESHITMMIGFIYPMNKWRCLILLSSRIIAVTEGAIFVKNLFA